MKKTASMTAFWSILFSIHVWHYSLFYPLFFDSIFISISLYATGCDIWDTHTLYIKENLIFNSSRLLSSHFKFSTHNKANLFCHALWNENEMKILEILSLRSIRFRCCCCWCWYIISVQTDTNFPTFWEMLVMFCCLIISILLFMIFQKHSQTILIK